MLDLSAFAPSERAPEVRLRETQPVAAVGELTAAVLERTVLACVHAGVVHGPNGAVAFAGPSGLGKSTLTAALVNAGFGYLSDEVLALDDQGMVHAFPRPISLDQRSVGVLQGRITPAHGEEVLVPLPSAPGIGPRRSRLAAVLLVQRTQVTAGHERDDAPPVIEPARRADAVSALVSNSFNHWKDPRVSLSTFVRAVRDAEVLQVEYGDAVRLASELAARWSVGDWRD